MELIWNLCEILFIEVAPGEQEIIPLQYQRCPSSLSSLSFLCVVMSILLPKMLLSSLFINITRKLYITPQNTAVLSDTTKKT